MWKKALAAFLALLIIFGLGLVLGVLSGRWLPIHGGPSFSGATVIKQVQTLSQLVTVKYVVEKVIVFDDAKWYGDNRVLLVAHGVVKAGIDLSKIQPADLQVSGTKITLSLPRPRITDVYLDDRQTEILERSTGIMRAFDKDLEQNARREAVEDLRGGALQNGIIKDSADRARAELTVLLYHLGFTEVDFRDK